MGDDHDDDLEVEDPFYQRSRQHYVDSLDSTRSVVVDGQDFYWIEGESFFFRSAAEFEDLEKDFPGLTGSDADKVLDFFGACNSFLIFLFAYAKDFAKLFKLDWCLLDEDQKNFVHALFNSLQGASNRLERVKLVIGQPYLFRAFYDIWALVRTVGHTPYTTFDSGFRYSEVPEFRTGFILPHSCFGFSFPLNKMTCSIFITQGMIKSEIFIEEDEPSPQEEVKGEDDSTKEAPSNEGQEVPPTEETRSPPPRQEASSEADGGYTEAKSKIVLAKERLDFFLSYPTEGANVWGGFVGTDLKEIIPTGLYQKEEVVTGWIENPKISVQKDVPMWLNQFFRWYLQYEEKSVREISTLCKQLLPWFSYVTIFLYMRNHFDVSDIRDLYAQLMLTVMCYAFPKPAETALESRNASPFAAGPVALWTLECFSRNKRRKYLSTEQPFIIIPSNFFDSEDDWKKVSKGRDTHINRGFNGFASSCLIRWGFSGSHPTALTSNCATPIQFRHSVESKMKLWSHGTDNMTLKSLSVFDPSRPGMIRDVFIKLLKIFSEDLGSEFQITKRPEQGLHPNLSLLRDTFSAQIHPFFLGVEHKGKQMMDVNAVCSLMAKRQSSSGSKDRGNGSPSGSKDNGSGSKGDSKGKRGKNDESEAGKTKLPGIFSSHFYRPERFCFLSWVSHPDQLSTDGGCGNPNCRRIHPGDIFNHERAMTSSGAELVFEDPNPDLNFFGGITCIVCHDPVVVAPIPVPPYSRLASFNLGHAPSISLENDLGPTIDLAYDLSASSSYVRQASDLWTYKSALGMLKDLSDEERRTLLEFHFTNPKGKGKGKNEKGKGFDKSGGGGGKGPSKGASHKGAWGNPNEDGPFKGSPYKGAWGNPNEDKPPPGNASAETDELLKRLKAEKEAFEAEKEAKRREMEAEAELFRAKMAREQ
jgi:hypothetical protein